MCLYIDRDIHAKINPPFRAKENIGIYKLLAPSSDFMSAAMWETPFRGMPVHFFDRKAVITVPPIVYHKYYVDFELNKYDPRIKVADEPSAFELVTDYTNVTDPKIVVTQGVHSLTTVKGMHEYIFNSGLFNCYAFEGIIPIGTKFYVGENNDIVSEYVELYEDNILPREEIEHPLKHTRKENNSISIEEYLEKYKHQLYE